MLELFSLINSWIWNIMGIIIGVPLLLALIIPTVLGIIACIVSIFTMGFKK